MPGAVKEVVIAETDWGFERNRLISPTIGISHMTAASREDWTRVPAVRKTRALRNLEGTGGRIHNLPVLGYGHAASS